MDLKIFTNGFTEKEFNNFCNNNLIYKYHVIDNGDVYLFYKNPAELGKRPIEMVEDLDRIVKQGMQETLAYELDKAGFNEEISKLSEEKSKFMPNQDEWKKLDKQIDGKTLSIKMADDSISNLSIKINSAKVMQGTILNK